MNVRVIMDLNNIAVAFQTVFRKAPRVRQRCLGGLTKGEEGQDMSFGFPQRHLNHCSPGMLYIGLLFKISSGERHTLLKPCLKKVTE